MLSAFMYELCASLLEGRYSIQRKFVIGIYSYGGTGHNHVADGFVYFEEVFGDGVGNSDQVCFEIFRVADYERGVNDGGEGFVREVSSL